MAHLIYFASFALIAISQVIDARPPNGEEYFCKPNHHFVTSDLDAWFERSSKWWYEDLNAVHNVLMKPEFSRDSYLGIPVTELLAMENPSEAECNLNEFEKRDYYRRIQPETSATSYFIENYLGELRKVCFDAKDGKLRQEALAATGADRDLIQKIIPASKLRKKTLTSLKVRKASERYVKKRPGKKEFVLSAKRLHILYACKHMRYVATLVWGLRHPYTLDPNFNMALCRFYVEDYGKKVETTLAKVSKFVGYAALFAAAAPILGPVELWLKIYHWLAEGDHVIVGFFFFLFTFPFWGSAGITYLIGAVGYSLAKLVYEKTPRDGSKGKYRIYPKTPEIYVYRKGELVLQD